VLAFPGSSGQALRG